MSTVVRPSSSRVPVLQALTTQEYPFSSGTLGRMSTNTLFEMVDYLDTSSLLRLKAVARPEYARIQNYLSDAITLIIDNSGSMSKRMSNGSGTREDVMVKTILALAATWSRRTQVLLLFVSPIDPQMELARYVGQVVGVRDLVDTVCPLLRNCAQGFSTNLCSCLLAMKHIGPTVIITDGDESEFESISQLYDRQLPIYTETPEQSRVTIEEAIARYNATLTPKETIKFHARPFEALLVLLRVFNPAYFLGAIIHADDRDHSSRDSEIVLHYSLAGRPDLKHLTTEVNRTTIPIEYGGPPNVSRLRPILVRERAQTIQKNRRMRNLVISSSIGETDSLQTPRIMLAKRYQQLKAGSIQFPEQCLVRDLGETTGLFQFINRNLVLMGEELATTAKERTVLATLFFTRPENRELVRQLGVEQYRSKMKAKRLDLLKKQRRGSLSDIEKRLETMESITNDDILLVLEPPRIMDPEYARYMTTLLRMQELGFELRTPRDWISVGCAHALFDPSAREGLTLHDSLLFGSRVEETRNCSPRHESKHAQ